MNKIKEKKLKSIKSEIEEIKNFISSKNNSEITENNFLDNSNNTLNNTLDDTLILNNIIRKEDKIFNISDLNDIKNDLKTLKSTISNHENILNEILSKIK